MIRDGHAESLSGIDVSTGVIITLLFLLPVHTITDNRAQEEKQGDREPLTATDIHY